MEISYEAPSLGALAARYAQGATIVAREQRVGMNRAVLLVEHDAKALAPWDTGHLRRSITHRLEVAGMTVTGIVGTNVPYAAAVEDGRRAGAPLPPPGVLLGWMRRHGLDPGEEVQTGKYAGQFSGEYALRRSIALKGIAPKPFLRPAYNQNRTQIQTELGTATVARIIAALKVGK